MTDSPRPVFDQLNLVVADMDASAAFYRRLGLDVPDAPADPRNGIAHADIAAGDAVDIDLDNVVLAQVYNADWRRPEGAGSHAVIGFRFPSRDAVDERYADLIGAGYRGVQPPFDAFWGSRYAIVADPDDNHVGLMSPRDPDMGTWPEVANSPDAP